MSNTTIKNVPSAYLSGTAPSTQSGSTLSPTMQRRLGAYYTPSSAAEFMADWAVRRDRSRMLEPSFGDGIFLRAVAKVSGVRNFEALQLFGVEVDPRARSLALVEDLISASDAILGDFLSVEPFPVDAVIGNPPYVRLRHVSAEQRESALSSAYQSMREPMDPSGSLWMPFVLHAMRFLEHGGRLAFVLPYEFTYVRYARPLWRILRDSFGSLRVLRSHERLFPHLLQDVVILLADEYGEHTPTVRYQAFEKVDSLLAEKPEIDQHLNIDRLIAGDRLFMDALLGSELRQVLRERVSQTTVPARELMRFNIGYVSGHKKFFHPDADAVQRFGLRDDHLQPSITSGRTIKSAGLRTSSLERSKSSRLFIPQVKSLTDGERQYIALGEREGVADRYKCRVRSPWYLVPGAQIPDVILTVFSERPILSVNDGQYLASNSLLCGYSLGPSGDSIALRWYTSLTLLQCELEVHALGGGVMVLVPRETGNIRLPSNVSLQRGDLDIVGRLLRQGQVAEAYASGNQHVLVKQLGFTQREVELIEHGVDVLAHWRTSSRTSKR